MENTKKANKTESKTISKKSAKNKVMIVDDSSFMRALLRNVLNKIGIKDVTEASLGKQAIDEFKKQKHDLVLLDIILPDVGGEEVLVEIMKAKPKPKVIMVTAVGQKPMMEKCRKLGVKDYIVKPFDNKKIEATIKRVLK